MYAVKSLGVALIVWSCFMEHYLCKFQFTYLPYQAALW